MTYAIIEAGVVSNVALATPEYAAEQGWPKLPAGAGIGWFYDGQSFSPPPPVVRDPEEIKAEIVAATQQRLDTFAQSRGYDGILSACTYAASPTPRFAAEGQHCVAMRDATWAKLIEIMNAVVAGTRPMPQSYADIKSELPELVWGDA